MGKYSCSGSRFLASRKAATSIAEYTGVSTKSEKATWMRVQSVTISQGTSTGEKEGAVGSQSGHSRVSASVSVFILPSTSAGGQLSRASTQRQALERKKTWPTTIRLPITVW